MTRRRVMQRLERDDLIALEVYAKLVEHHASLDESVRVAGTIIGWSYEVRRESGMRSLGRSPPNG